ncbi:Eco57I restriction-modification methylase domain-containing protein [Lyngbya sp. CCY1209]|uniref:HsdM family class I SAM-dependent methyltransferase n=1 Tax=Lyngbya sp. CCY1209 TaxID=2886103 RepID=UPI002D207002|nr:N-6 DNA methylase [Lyngbya sp. CCY1209]MEB3883991.1 N-6 DNA methylase [Lyngbya sp. CCY1209]
MLELAHQRLYWPEPDQIWEPSGSGPKVYAKLAREKIGEKLKREFREDTQGLKVSVLAANPKGDETEAPLAIICQFSRPVSQEIIEKTYRLAWSFSRARSLITIEPQLLRVWSCCEPPKDKDEEEPNSVFRITENDLVEQAANALQWVELVSGEFFQKHENRFQRSGAADQMLLSNLKEVRQQLQNKGLDSETIHDLLARIIFIQFLFQKQDSNGIPALNNTILEELHRQGILSKVYGEGELPEILDNFDDTYNLFRWLNNKFNGDLFPGKGETEDQREAEWQAEIQRVRREGNRYLTTLAEFVRGDLDMGSGQLCLWPYYSFDVIPLDFISSLYEEFVTQKPKKIKKIGAGVHYTPEYIVDFILDGVLPWNELEWDLKILDPACGSGIFLVKAFQRLIYRWEVAHNGQRIPGDVLRTLLEKNLFGVDIDKEAVRVASFSLYLTMLDSIEPSEYWENEVRFPRLRDKRLICADFFDETCSGFRSNLDAGTYDLVVGNAPWGESSSTPIAKSWAKENNWTIADNNIGTLFTAKSIYLIKQGGLLSLIQPVSTLLSNQQKPAKKFRDRLFEEVKIEEIVNLSALRFKIFSKAVSPPCIMSLRRTTSGGEPFYYICPKPNQEQEDTYKIIIEPPDLHIVYPHEVRKNPTIWSSLMWGNRRDLQLISRLNNASNLAKLKEQGIAKTRQGIIRGTKRKKIEFIKNKRILEGPRSSNLIENSFLILKSDDLPINDNDEVHWKDSTSFSAFRSPQMILKMSYPSQRKRFLAVLIQPEKSGEGIVCSGSYVTVHIEPENLSIMEAACLSYNSKLAVYYLLLSSHRFANYRPEIKPSDLLRVPIPDRVTLSIEDIQSWEDVDEAVRAAFSFKDSEWTLINDLFDYTLADFKEGSKSSPGRQKTCRLIHHSVDNLQEPHLTPYCEYFMRVIRASFGQEKEVCATIFQESNDDYLPVRLVAVYLNKFIHNGIKIEPIISHLLLERLNEVNDFFINQNNSGAGGIFYQRVARVYESTEWNGEPVPTIYLIKPDKIRYWTRSMALRDADEVVADIMAAAYGNNQSF